MTTDQASVNCKLELKYAQQCGVEIVPVVMEGSGWRASGWLGILTAGALWTRLSDESAFDENVRQLHGQIQQVVGAAPEIEEVSDEGTATAREVSEELERLREDLDTKAESQKAGATVLADPSQPATIPAGVPKLPPKFQTTEQIEELTRLVLSTDAPDMSMSRVGFWGMGGIGKTVTGAAIVRNADVRLHFDIIIWLPLGQTPVISKLQNLCHMQCTGKELSPELSTEEKKEALQQAMSGKRVLLCLDDLWEEEHELKLNFVDVDAGSKVLISTRMRALLNGGHQVEVGLPSPPDSARMLLRAADADSSSAQPAGVSEIVDLCGRLPLALGIAGRLAASLGLVGTADWSDMIGVLKEELRESHSGGAEEGMIRASLRGLKGSATEQANVKSLLLLFALVPEDTHCPLDVLLLMFNAVHTDVGATLMHIRKWLRVLINRSLVLGTIERPSVHDLVLDFAIARHSDEALRNGHRCIVEAFRAARPSNIHGRRQFDMMRQEDPVSSYVCSEGGSHLEEGWETEMENDVHALTHWLGDVPQDALVQHAGQVLGVDRLLSLAGRAESRGDCWLAGRYFAVACALKAHTEGNGNAIDIACKALDALGLCLEQVGPHTLGDVHEVQLAMFMKQGVAGDLFGLAARRSEVEVVLNSQASVRDPLSSSMISMLLCFPLLAAGDIKRSGAVLFAGFTALVSAAKSYPDLATRQRCGLTAYAWPHLFEIQLLQPTFSWDDYFGKDGAMLLDVANKYFYDRDHAFVLAGTNGEFMHMLGGTWVPFAVHYGDVDMALAQFDKSLDVARRCIEESEQALELPGLVMGLGSLGHLAVACELPLDRREAIAQLMVAWGLTWDTADQFADRLAVEWGNYWRSRGDRTRNAGHMFTADNSGWCMKCAYVLVSSHRTVTSAEVMASLPSVAETIEFGMTFDTLGNNGYQNALNTFVCTAQICEKFGEHDKTLIYAAAALDTDLTKAGTELPSERIFAYLLQGRAHAALGQTTEAAASFESAADEAHRYGYFLWEAFALRDLKLLVLDGMGDGDGHHGHHGSQRLGAALRQLKGPADKLTPMLKGCDAAQLMALPPPDGAFTVVYPEQEDPAVAALRQELTGLKLKKLKSRARELGVSEEALNDADDEDDVKAAVIGLCVETATADEGGGEEVAALRAELAQLVPKALKNRAREAGVSADALEDADDADDVKQAVTDLIVVASQEAGRGRTSPPDANHRIVYEAEDPATAALREELGGLRLMALQKRALSEGAADKDIEDAMDSDNAKAALVELLLQQHVSVATAEDAAQQVLRDQLKALRLMALQKRAASAGIAEEDIEDAIDGDDPKGALVELIVQLETDLE